MNSPLASIAEGRWSGLVDSSASVLFGKYLILPSTATPHSRCAACALSNGLTVGSTHGNAIYFRSISGIAIIGKRYHPSHLTASTSSIRKTNFGFTLINLSLSKDCTIEQIESRGSHDGIPLLPTHWCDCDVQNFLLAMRVQETYSSIKQ